MYSTWYIDPNDIENEIHYQYPYPTSIKKCDILMNRYPNIIKKTISIQHLVRNCTRKKLQGTCAKLALWYSQAKEKLH